MPLNPPEPFYPGTTHPQPIADTPQFRDLRRDLDTLYALTGNAQNARVAGDVSVPPTVASFTVVGQDGRFIIDIVNAANAAGTPGVSGVGTAKSITQLQRQQGQGQRVLESNAALFSAGMAPAGAVYHQLQSSTNLLWDLIGNLQEYGPEMRTHWSIEDPNATRYWRIRSKYLNSDYNAWTYFESAAVCGVVAVWAGLLRTSSLTQVNSAATYTGASPLTQHGLTTQIDVGSTSWKVGDLTVPYTVGSCDPGSYGLFYVYADDPKRAGGVVTYVATANVADLTAADGRLYFGKITTAAGGGGAGSGGGSGACVVGDCDIDVPGGGTTKQSDLRVGDVVLGVDGGEERIERIELIPSFPCFRIEVANGTVLRGVSSDGPLRYAGGGWVKAFDVIVSDVLQTKSGPSAVTAKQYIGDFTVYYMQLSRTKTFIADGVVKHNTAAAQK